MRNATFLVTTFIILYLNGTMGGELNMNSDHEGSHQLKVRSNIRASFNQLLRSAISFFNVSIGQIEAKRRKIKKAFCNFIDEAFKEKTVHSNDTNSSRFSNHFVNAESAFTAIVLSHGYQAETHTVLTVDGYILTVHKIKPEIQNFVQLRKSIVLFQHGIFGSSVDWILLGPKKSLPYLILKTGCEVWFANSRGNAFSKSHVSKIIDSPDFWDFSLHEMGIYDLSATLDYIIDVSDSRSDIVFIGHSSGCAALLILLAAAPRYNGLIKIGIFLAPLVFVTHADGPMRYFSQLYNQKNTKIMGETTLSEFIPSGKAVEEVLRIFCKNYPNKNVLTCLRYSGKDDIPNNLNYTILEAALSGGSEKALIHYFQMMRSGHFRRFDYGREVNLVRYGQLVPPRYHLRDIALKIYIFTSSEDLLSNEEDLTILVNNLPKVEDRVMITRKGFSHIHFLIDEYASELVYNRLSQFFE